MIPKTPQEEEVDQLELKRDEAETIKADLERWRRLLKLALDHGKMERAQELKDDIGIQEKYLEDLSYEIQVLEVETDGEPQGEEKRDSKPQAPHHNADGSERTGGEEPGGTDSGASEEDPDEQGQA